MPLGPHRQAAGLARSRVSKEKDQEPLSVVSSGKVRRVGLGLASLSNFIRLWGVGWSAVVWFLALGT